jgi:hypothetical protein
VHASLVGHAQALLHAPQVGVAGLEAGQPSGAQLRRDVAAGVRPVVDFMNQFRL